MPYCPQCGVEVDAGLVECPLCGSSVQDKKPERIAPYPTIPVLPHVPRLPPAYVRLYLFETVSLLLGSALLAVLCVDIFADWQFDWSLRVIVVLAGSWCLVSIVLYCYRSLSVMHTSIVITTAIMLALLDLCNGRLDWFVPLSLPILALEFVLVGAILALRRIIPVGWANLTAFTFLAIAVFCCGVDLIIDRYAGRPLLPTWSLAVAISLLPPVLFFTYVHYRLRKQLNLGRYFHV